MTKLFVMTIGISINLERTKKSDVPVLGMSYGVDFWYYEMQGPSHEASTISRFYSCYFDLDRMLENNNSGTISY